VKVSSAVKVSRTTFTFTFTFNCHPGKTHTDELGCGNALMIINIALRQNSTPIPQLSNTVTKRKQKHRRAGGNRGVPTDPQQGYIETVCMQCSLLRECTVRCNKWVKIAVEERPYRIRHATCKHS
jgi:hypothetical protein